MNRLLPYLLLLFSGSVPADHYPGHATLEWGLGIVALSTPDYIGSSISQQQLLPFPYLKYRGKRLRIDDGVEARLFDSADLVLSISGNGSLPGSKDNPQRAGMDELDISVEFGPSLEYQLQRNASSSVWLELPLRYAFSIEHNLDTIGRVFHPRLAWRRPAAHKFAWKLRLASGPLYADADFHGYYYNVRAHEVNAQRSEFIAESGYSGWRSDFTYSRRIDRLWLGGFVRFDVINHSEIEDSPLVSTDNNWTAGVALAWIFSEL